ncbi:FAD-dependent oxidoreductase [Aestuariispira ectoiniformans]|uniref:FAD-dependent oxidoreductase n=1 Tax=Aestuariispira ectoiniformans TaxID=2775080 RepID=UPI00223AC3F3|nr:FAD-dependent oxidoreductase [Aestuariispira ectoiniformans]
MTLTVAIIGSGPSGMYLADRLAKKLPDSQIDVIDRLPTPFGLVRAGVAPDHQGTKKVINQYEKLFSQPGIRFLGNVEVDRDVTIAELKQFYDAVVIATGAQVDRKLGIEGEDLKGVYGSAAFVGWYNGHPDYRDLTPVHHHIRSAVVIGNGNVSIDISRVLVKEPGEMEESDLCEHARAAIHNAEVETVYLAGRRGPIEASFTPPELRELGKLESAIPVIENTALPDDLPDWVDTSVPEGRVRSKNLEIFKSFQELDASSAQKKIHLLFQASPAAILGNDQGEVRAVRFERTEIDGNGKATGTGEFFEVPADLVVTAIGYRSRALAGVSFDDKRGGYPNEDGLIEENVYVVGWGKRGPSGTIPTNRADSFQVADRLIADLGDGQSKGGPEALNRLLVERGVRVTTAKDWQLIDQLEVNRATGPAPREKLTRVQDMLDSLD